MGAGRSDPGTVPVVAEDEAANGVPDEAPLEGDQLPEDLDISEFVGPTVYPDVSKRRITGTILRRALL